MDTDATARLFALLTVAIQLFVVVVGLGAAASRWMPSSRLAQLAVRARHVIAADAMWLATVVALATTLGSLYLSEIANFPPCKLCWYQRIAMYPLALICGIAAYSRDRAVARAVVPLCAIGGAISIYHYQLERFPDQRTLTCALDVPCTTVWIWEFHYLSIPLMALSAFAAIALLMTLARPLSPRTFSEGDSP